MLRVDLRSVTERLASIGAQLRDARLKAGLTQSDVAARAGVTRQLVSRIESGHPAGEVAALVSVAAALDYQIVAQPSRPHNRGEQAARELIERLRTPPAAYTRDNARPIADGGGGPLADGDGFVGPGGHE